MGVNLWDFEGVPYGLANLFFGGDLLTAQIVLTAFITFCMVLPGIIARTKPDIIMLLAFFAVLICTAIGWMNSALFMIVIAFMALLYAGIVRKVIGA
jgi:hypothetical protein